MNKLEQKGFTLIEMLISIGILGIIAPLLVVALFQILTFTERGRAGFEAQADTRNAAAWISQDVVMAQKATHAPEDFPFDTADLASGTSIPHPMKCDQPVVTFAWVDLFADLEEAHWVSYCWEDNDAAQNCLPDSACLIRTYDGDSNVVGRNIESVSFARDTGGKEITITIKSAPENRFGIEDQKEFKVVMRPTL